MERTGSEPPRTYKDSESQPALWVGPPVIQNRDWPSFHLSGFLQRAVLRRILSLCPSSVGSSAVGDGRWLC